MLLKSGAVILLFSIGCALVVQSLAQEVNVSSSRVDCDTYASEDPECPSFCPRRCPSKNITLYIQGFVPAGVENGQVVYSSETIVPSAFAAIDDINADCSILPKYILELEFVNTQCDPSEATWQLINSIVLQEDRDNHRIMFLGGGCSLATEPLAALAGRFYQISMLSYGASSPSLSNTEMFPNFFRTIPSEVQSNSARFALMMTYNWTKVATLHETQTIFSQTVEDFHTEYDRLYNNRSGDDQSNEEDDNLILRSFTDDPEIPLKQIKDKDIRIIMGYFYEDKALATLCRAYKMGLTTPAHVWIFPAWYDPDWYKDNYPKGNVTENTLCTKEQLKQAVRYSFFLDSYNRSANQTDTATNTGNTTTDLFIKKYDCYLKEFKTNPQSSKWATDDSVPHAYISFTYDGLWAIAFALHETEAELEKGGSNLTLADFEYFNKTAEIGEAIKRHLMKTNFSGVSGKVTFDSNGDRMGLNGIYQLRENDDGELVQELLAIHQPRINNETNYSFDFNVTPLWKGGSAPSDRRLPENQYLQTSLVIFCHFLTTIAIVVAVCLLVFNLATLWKPLIRDSAPHINTIVIIGCIIMLVGCYLLGIDSNNPPLQSYKEFVRKEDVDVPENVIMERDNRYKVICNVRLWILTLGFTLSFGALFAKTWQVYRVYTNSELKKKEFKMWNFLIIMGIFLLIDLAYLSFWTGTYTFYRAVDDKIDENKDIDLQYEKCECQNYGYLIGALYVYKGLLVVFGLFLAYESRNVKYFYINDSRFVSITMYIVVILVGIGAPLSLVLAVHNFIDAAYGLAVVMIIAACMSCLLILYIPKFYYMAKGEDTMVSENQREEITVSDGLQLGRSTVDTMDVKMAEDEVSTLQKQVTEKNLELKELQSHNDNRGGGKPRNGSDGDSGVLVTGDENETFSTESTANGDHIRAEAGEAGTGSSSARIDTTCLDECEESETATDGTTV